jgi:hypothetical protein
MDINKKLLAEINRFKTMYGYQPGRLLNEQKYELIKEDTYPGVNNITWMEPGDNGNDFQTSSNERTGYMGSVIGTIEDDVLILNEIGNFIFDKRKYPKTIEQVELLETQGRVKISSSDEGFLDYSKITNDKKKSIVKKNEIQPNKIKKRYIRQSQRMFREKMEQNINSANWRGKNTGSMMIQSIYPAAYNCGNYLGYLWIGSKGNFNIGKPSLPEYQPVYSGDTTTGDTIDNFNIGQDFKVYKDNMVQPKIFEEGPAKEQFDKIVEDFVIYIQNGGFDKLTNVTIQGRADSANPTWDIPAGETSLDHNYGGIKRKSSYTEDELDEMNIYLARERARNYKNKLIEAIKNRTGKEITIKELEPISYRGQIGKRGGQWRSINLMANAPKLEIINVDPVKLQKYNDYIKTRDEKQKQLDSGYYPITAEIGTSVGIVTVSTDTDGAPLVINRKELANSGNYTTEGIYLRTDAVDYYSIPDYPTSTISNVSVRIDDNVVGGTIKFTDTNGKTQIYPLVPFSRADDEKNVISLDHRKGGGMLSPYMGGSDYNPGASAQGQVRTCPGNRGKIASSVPFTVIDPQGKQIAYKGKYYIQLTNIWFAYTAMVCGDPNIENNIDYYNVPEFEYIFR